jgi:PKD repeat protein
MYSPVTFLSFKRAFCLLFLLFFNSGLFAQRKADFSVDKTGGCSPLTVSFKNTTTGASSGAKYNWVLGNGNTSTLVSAGATYREEKTYTVTLTVSDGSQTSSASKQITVYKKPVVDFSASTTKGCLPLFVNFNSSSTAGDGTVTSNFWDFGDGVTQRATDANYAHTYNFATRASVSLTVTNSNGCSNTFTKPDLIEVLPSVKAGFTADKTILCKTSDAVQFTNTSSGPADITYLWEFGDGKTSVEKIHCMSTTKKASMM